MRRGKFLGGPITPLEALVAMALVAAGHWFVGKELGIKEHQEEAVKAGHAEFFIDEDHERQFRWLTPEPQEDE